VRNNYDLNRVLSPVSNRENNVDSPTIFNNKQQPTQLPQPQLNRAQQPSPRTAGIHI
jgi:hypothetical protein